MGNSFGTGGDPVEQQLIGSGNPLADPLLNYASQYALLQLGQAPDFAMSGQGSPISVAAARYLNQVPGEVGLIQALMTDVNTVMEAIAAGEEPELSPAGLRRLARVASAVGMSAEQLLQAQEQYGVQQKEQFEQASAAAEMNRQGQYDAMSQLATLIGDLPDVSEAGMEEYKEMQKERLLRDLNRSVDEASLQATRQANFANYNPGRVLGDLEESRIRGTQDADLAALEYALVALSGEQNLAASRTSQLQNYINYPSQLAAQLSGIRASGTNVPTQVIGQQVLPNAMSNTMGQVGGGIQSANMLLDLISNISSAWGQVGGGSPGHGQTGTTVQGLPWKT